MRNHSGHPLFRLFARQDRKNGALRPQTNIGLKLVAILITEAGAEPGADSRSPCRDRFQAFRYPDRQSLWRTGDQRRKY